MRPGFGLGANGFSYPRRVSPAAPACRGAAAAGAGYALLRSDPSSHGAADPARSTPAHGRTSSVSG
jgi:hypothetical protein